jgi:hypothetical protein
MTLQAYLGQNNHCMLLFGFERPESSLVFCSLNIEIVKKRSHELMGL